MSGGAKIRSLTRQTAGSVLVTQLVGALLLSGAALLHERHARMRSFDEGLQGRSDSLLGAIQDAEDVNDNVTIDPSELLLPSADVYAVYGENGRVIGRSADAPAALIARERDGFRDVRLHHAVYRVLQRQAMRVIDRSEFKGVGLRRPVTILYAQSEAHLWHDTLEGARFYLGAIALVAGLTVVLVLLLLRRALQPIADLAQATGRLSGRSLMFVAPESALAVRELRPLATTLAGAIARLRDAFEKEQRFVGDATHELKTAVAVVRSSVQLLMLRRRSAEEYAAGLERVLEDNGRVEALVTQMLDLARLEEVAIGQVAPLDLLESAQATIAQLQPIAVERGLAIVCAGRPGMRIRLQASRAQVLVSNLALNAMQHSEPGTRIEVSVEREAAGAVMLRVRDAGAGIGPEALPHVFDRFYREDRSRSRATGGAGLGLSICKSIVDGARGRIDLASEVGAGTTVTVTLPLAESDGGEPLDGSSAADAERVDVGEA